MNQTQLELLFIDSTNEKILVIQDVSLYNPDVDVENPTLKILPPNFSTQYTLIYPESSTIYINSNALGWSIFTSLYAIPILPDCLWLIYQSVKPNDCVYKIHNHFRIINLKKKIMCYVSSQLDDSSNVCALGADWYKDIFILLQLLESSKYMVECCGDVERGIIIYNQVERDFKKYSCQSNC